jgi:hypothetical protein
MPDLTNLFSTVFAKADQIQKSGGEWTPTKITPESNALSDAHNSSLYPEKTGKKKHEEKLKAQKEYEEFLKTITEDEYGNLVYLAKDRLLISKSQLIAIGESGEELHMERLEKAGCAKRELIDDMIEIHITSFGRKVLREIQRMMS